MYKLSSRSLANMHGVHNDLQRVAKRAIEITKIDFGIPELGGLRNAAQQRALYESGKSKCDGTRKKSRHQTGLALDFYAYVDGKGSWSKEHLAQVACAFFQAASELDIGLKWGGLFTSFTDMPHVELTDV